MARPTDEVKNHILKCRIGDDLYERLKGKNTSEVVREALEKYFKGNSAPRKDSFVPQNVKALEEENRTLKQTIEFLKADESVHTISDKAMECVKEVSSILEFFDADEEIFWSDLLDKVTNGDMSSGKLKLDGGTLFTASRKEEVAPILANLEKLCFDRGVNTEEAYEKVLSVGAKITYKDIQGASIG